MFKKSSAVTFWILIGSGLLFVLSLMVMGNILTIGNNLKEVHPALSIAFYVVTVLLLFFLLVRPLLSVFSLPEIKASDYLDEDSTIPDHKEAAKTARTLMKQGQLDQEEHHVLKAALKSGENPTGTLEKIFDTRLERMDEIIHRHAKQVFISTALSQNGRLDALLVLTINFRMLKELISSYGYRPTYATLVKTYTKVMAAALIADGIEDTEFAELFPMLSRGFLGAIPGLGTVSSSFLQGSGNAFLTLRVGYITKNYYMTSGHGYSRRQARIAANKAALKKLSLIIRESLMVFPREAQKKARQVLKFV